jgi:pimeloyl-ACP methyl ester carboxylesterase
MRLLKFAALCLHTFVLTTAHAADAPRPLRDEVLKQDQIYGSAGQKVPEGYVVGRSLLSYAFTLAPGFRQSLGRLGASDRWLDIGAGEGNAVLDYRSSNYEVLLRSAGSTGGGKAAAVALSIEDRRTARWHETAARVGEKQLRYVFGRRLREYSPAELGQFQLITDVLGAFSYTRFASVFMEKALGLLTVDGSFYTLLQDVQFENGRNQPAFAGSAFLTELVKSDGSELKVCSWLKSIACVEVTCEARPQTTPPSEVYHLRKVCDGVRVPPLTLAQFQAGTPPERRFQLQEAPAGATFAELQKGLVGRPGNLDLFRARGPFGVVTQKDRDVQAAPSERIRADLFLSAPEGKAPLVIFVHGHESSKRAHANQAMHVASWGMHALAVQLPSKGPWDVNGRILARLVSQLQHAPEAIDRRIDASRIILVGHSFGAVAAAVALAEGAPAAGAILLDPAAAGKAIETVLRRVAKPVMILGADEAVSAARNRDYFYEFIRSGIAELSIRDAGHEDAQDPTDFALQNGGYDPQATEELQMAFVSALTATAISLAATGTLDYAWASFRPAFDSGRFFDAKKK